MKKYHRITPSGISHKNEANYHRHFRQPEPPKIVLIRFVDVGQDFREWTVNAQTGEVVASDGQPGAWEGKFVDEPKHLKIGDRVQISDQPIDPTNEEQEFSTINYPVLKITIR